MNKFTVFFILLTGIFTSTFAQEPCGTVMTPEMWDQLDEFHANKQGWSASRSANDLYVIPLSIHIVGRDNGSGYYDYATLLDVLCEVNDHYAPANMYFYIKGEVEYINNSSYYEHTSSNINLFNYNKSNTVNVYFVGDPAGNCGYFNYWRNAVAVRNSCAEKGETTLVHELGHFFSLPHTFSGWEGHDYNSDPIPQWQWEKVDGSNCSARGDGFCDTPPDYLSYRWSCPTAPLTDPDGATFTPDGSFYMSYAADRCNSRFSNEQIQAMRYNVSVTRSSLLSGTPPSIDTLSATIQQYPVDGQQNVAPNQVLLKWKSVKGADKYILKLNSYTSEKYIVEDTFFQATLAANKPYFWQVKPFSAGYTCAGYTDGFTFQTGDNWIVLPTATTQPVSCPGGNDGQISVSATGGTAPYIYEWPDGGFGSDRADLAGGIYEVTVTDAFGNESVLPVLVEAPQPMEVEIEEYGSDNRYIVSAEGGGGLPYSYVWSDGTSGAVLSPAQAGTYTVTVTDGQGCSKVETVEAEAGVGIFDAPEVVKDIRLYPNPIENGYRLNIRFAAEETGDGTIGIYNLQGKLVNSLGATFNSGENNHQLEVNGLAAGMYMVKIQAEGFTAVRKLTVY